MAKKNSKAAEAEAPKAPAKRSSKKKAANAPVDLDKAHYDMEQDYLKRLEEMRQEGIRRQKEQEED